MKFSTRVRRQPTITIVSLIDILAILLLFFIVTTTFKKRQPQVVINLPKSSTAVEAAATVEPVRILIDESGGIALGDGKVSIEQLGREIKRIRARSPERPFSLEADRKADFGVVIQVLDVLKEMGVENLPAFMEKM